MRTEFESSLMDQTRLLQRQKWKHSLNSRQCFLPQLNGAKHRQSGEDQNQKKGGSMNTTLSTPESPDPQKTIKGKLKKAIYYCEATLSGLPPENWFN